MPKQIQLSTYVFIKENPTMFEAGLIEEYCKTQKYAIVAHSIIEADDDNGFEEVKQDTAIMTGYVQLHKRTDINKVSKLLRNAKVSRALGGVLANVKKIRQMSVVLECGLCSTRSIAAKKGGDVIKARWKEIVKLATAGKVDVIKDLYPAEYSRCFNAIHACALENERNRTTFCAAIKDAELLRQMIEQMKERVNELKSNPRDQIASMVNMAELRDAQFAYYKLKDEESKLVSDNL